VISENCQLFVDQDGLASPVRIGLLCPEQAMLAEDTVTGILFIGYKCLSEYILAGLSSENFSQTLGEEKSTNNEE
jgi:hypothetical protein